MVHDCGQRRSIDLTGRRRFVGREDLIDIVVEAVVMLLAKMKREVAADPDNKQGRGPNQKSVPVHRKEGGVKRRLRRSKLYHGRYDAARSVSTAAWARLSSSRVAPSCLSDGSTARVRNVRGLIPPPPIRRLL